MKRIHARGFGFPRFFVFGVVAIPVLFLCSRIAAASATSSHDAQHVMVYQPEAGGYAGWPANYGIWSWGNEIVVVFTRGTHDTSGSFHARSRTRPFVTMQARSLDGGLTWQTGLIPAHTPGGRGLSADEHMERDLWVAAMLNGKEAPVPHPGNVDFTQPDFALMCARTNLKAGAVSWFYTSTDRCRSWQGPYSLPMFGQKGIAARTDCLVSEPRELLLFLTSTKADGDEGRVFCARTTDGGKSFSFVSWLGEERKGFEIMPASVRLSSSRILTAVRCRDTVGAGGEKRRDWIDLYASNDNAASWTRLGSPVSSTGNGGSPPTLMKLRDGRLCMTYGYRDAPFGIRAQLSSDEGKTWGEEIILRDDGGSHDLGYPRTTQRPDGRIVTAYYYNDRPGGPGYIAATVWKP